jgi:hypothetical protein
MMWFNGIGSGWAGCIQEFLVMVVLWGTVITASIRIEYVLAEGSAQGETDSHQWHRRLM